MSRRTEVMTAVGTLACAIGVGFIMQSGEVAELRYGPAPLKSASAMPFVGEPAPVVTSSKKIEVVPFEPIAMQDIKLTSAQVPALAKVGLTPLALEIVADADVFNLYLKPQSFWGGLVAPEPEKMPDCPIEATATPQAAAMIDYKLSAPCFAGAEVVITHEDLMFSEVLSEDGTLIAEIPALAQDATVRAFFTTGETMETSLPIESFHLYDRVLVQWRGATGVQIHAREFGAAYGDAGHVWSGSERDRSAIAEGQGGYMNTLGDDTLDGAHIAEVYTFPTALSRMSGAVDLTVETEVTAQNCGRDIRAKAIQFTAGKQVSSQDLTLSVPDCSTIGSFLVLNNLLQDLTVASK